MNQSQSAIVPQTDPKAGYLAHQFEIDSAVQRVLNSGWYIKGDEVNAFEQAFAAFVGVRHAIGVGNGTDALELALRACGIGPGDIVFTVSHTAVATVAAIELVGATPVLIDINPATYTIDPEFLESTLRSLPAAGRPKAIIPVHLYGCPADMNAILEIAHRHELYVIEDCAQSHGAILKGRMTGSWGDIGTFSFYPTKNLGALGDGGMVVTDNPMLAERLRLLQEYGWRDRYISEIPGRNTRLDEIQAAILRVKLRYLNEENSLRRSVAHTYDTMLSTYAISVPWIHPDSVHAFHQYVVRLSVRDKLKDSLKKNGISTLIHYPRPIHLQPAYQGRLPFIASLSVTEQITPQILSLPMFPQLHDEQIRHVGRSIGIFYGSEK